MRSRPIAAGQSILASQNNDKRDDARGGSFLVTHQQLGVLVLGTAPSNGQVIPIVINGTTITITAKTGSVVNPNDVLSPGTALQFATNVLNFLRRPDLTNANQVAASNANQSLLQYVGWAWPGSSTNIVPFSLNKNVNGITGPLSSFNITGITVTSGTWTAQTMKLYVEDGTYYIGITRVLFTGGSTPTVTAPVSNPRIDVLTADSSGTLAWTTGTENASPVAPTYPAGKVPVCELYNVVSETALYDNENQQASQGYILNDVRPFSTPVYISDPGQIANGTITAANLNASLGLIPSGSMVMWGTTSAPSGWLTCDGSAVSRTTYSVLFGVIGTTFGTGDGSTTFNLPNLKSTFPAGYNSGDSNFNAMGKTGGEASNSHTHTLAETYTNIGFGGSIHGMANADTFTTSGPSDTSNLPPYIALNFIIKQ